VVDIPEVSEKMNAAYHFFPIEDIALVTPLIGISVLLLINSVAIIILYKSSPYGISSHKKVFA